MPTAIERPNYDGTYQFITPTASTTNAAKAQGPVVTAGGALDVNSTLTVTNAGDLEYTSARHFIGCWQFFDIPARPANNVVVKAFYSPLNTVHSRIIVDEFGFSALALKWSIEAICFLSKPALGWQRSILIDSLTDNNFRSHVVPNTIGAPRGGSFTGRWPLSATQFPNGLNVFVGLRMIHGVTSDDVTVTSVVQSKGMLKFIAVSY